MSLVKTLLGGALSPLLVKTPFWAVKMESGAFLSERDLVHDGNRADDPRYPQGKRPFDWGLDLVASGDWQHVRELWLFCPPSRENPFGQTAHFTLPPGEYGTLFQFKVGFLDSTLTGAARSSPAQLIGHVTDTASGACTCCIWDAIGQCLLVNWRSNVYNMGSWRPEIAPIGRLEPGILGLSLR